MFLGDNVWDFRLGPCWLWASTLVSMVNVLLCILFVLPREETRITWVGRVTMYPYLLHRMVLFYRMQAVILYGPPLLQSPWAHAAIILLSLGFAVLVVLISS